MTMTTRQVRGLAIKAARELAGLGQNELADSIGVSHQTIRRTEHGGRSPRFEEVEKIAEVTGVDYAWLMNPDTFLPPSWNNPDGTPDRVAGASGPYCDAGEEETYNVRRIADGSAKRGTVVPITALAG